MMDSTTSSPGPTSAMNISRFSSGDGRVQACEHEADGSQMRAAGLGPQGRPQRIVDKFADVWSHTSEQDDGAPASAGVRGVAHLAAERCELIADELTAARDPSCFAPGQAGAATPSGRDP
ncbi:hypothetical protein ACPPVO_36125 [Dactylosporangium sp. McL0621]|uniref:hypothetical protein n=1 Tax=Dactylosporangium sp. McL0621 TaxID=3415678 RepID=UPI003CF28E5A